MTQLDEKTGYSVVVPQANANGIAGTKQFNYNPADQSFSPSDNSNYKLYTPASTGFESRFQVQSGKTLTDFINNGITRLKSFFDPAKNDLDVTSLQNSFGGSPDKTQTGPFMSPTVVSGTGETTPASTAETFAPPKTEVPKENFFTKAVDFLKGKPGPTLTMPQDTIGRTQGNLDISGFDTSKTNFPSMNLNLPSFNLPSFNTNFGSPGGSFIQPGGATFSGPSMGPTTSTNTGLLDKVKNFGSTALGNIKKFFGF
jgi:hypothetical protein